MLNYNNPYSMFCKAPRFSSASVFLIVPKAWTKVKKKIQYKLVKVVTYSFFKKILIKLKYITKDKG